LQGLFRSGGGGSADTNFYADGGNSDINTNADGDTNFTAADSDTDHDNTDGDANFTAADSDTYITATNEYADSDSDSLHGDRRDDHHACAHVQ